jgi:hypothetical protein
MGDSVVGITFRTTLLTVARHSLLYMPNLADSQTILH